MGLTSGLAACRRSVDGLLGPLVGPPEGGHEKVRYPNHLVTNPTPPPAPELLDAARAAARLSKQLEIALADVDLTLPQYRALVFINRGTRAPSALAGQLAVSRPTITALIDGLVARDLVERRPDPNDGRRIEHQLTPTGTTALAHADAAVAGRLGAVVDRLPARDQERAIQGLHLWSAAIDAALAASQAAAAGAGRG